MPSEGVRHEGRKKDKQTKKKQKEYDTFWDISPCTLIEDGQRLFHYQADVYIVQYSRRVSL
jgi:hypothetical protein